MCGMLGCSTATRRGRCCEFRSDNLLVAAMNPERGAETPKNHARYTHEIDGNLLSNTQMPDCLYQVSAWKIARSLGRVRERRSAFNLRMILPFCPFGPKLWRFAKRNLGCCCAKSLRHGSSKSVSTAYYVPTNAKHPLSHLAEVSRKSLIYLGILAPAVGIEPTTN